MQESTHKNISRTDQARHQRARAEPQRVTQAKATTRRRGPPIKRIDWMQQSTVTPAPRHLETQNESNEASKLTENNGTRRRAVQHTACVHTPPRNHLRIEAQNETRTTSKPQTTITMSDLIGLTAEMLHDHTSAKIRSPCHKRQAPRDASATKGTRPRIPAPCHHEDARPHAREDEPNRPWSNSHGSPRRTIQQATEWRPTRNTTATVEAHILHRSPQ